MISKEGDIKILDFGSLKGSGEELATRRYLSTSRWNGGEVQTRDDLVSLVLIYREMTDIDFRLAPQESWVRRADSIESNLQETLDSFYGGDVSQEEECETRSKLGDLIKSMLAAGSIELSSTRVPLSLETEKSAKVGPIKPLAVLLFLLLNCIFIKTDGRMLPSKIEVRTSRWHEVLINGKRMGHTPFSATGIFPQRTLVHLRGQSATKEIRLIVHPGKTERINDSSLRDVK